MKSLRKNPHIYEINTMTWLESLSRREGKRITLKDIPMSEWQYLKEIGIDFIWLMGVWQRSSYSKNRARRSKGLVEAGKNLLSDFTIKDMDGSPYSIYEYIPDKRFGTIGDLKDLKKNLEQEGLHLILDFVPNHMACDHPWTISHPEYFVHLTGSNTDKCPEGYFPSVTDSHNICIAHGKDPYFAPWDDTAQVNYSSRETIEAMTRLLCELSECCHGLRCDMAMLLLKEVFQGTWGDISNGDFIEFWPAAIERLRSTGNMCILLAEVYWSREKELLEYGFEYTYDKTLYDLMVRGDITGIKNHISAPIEFQEKMVRFLENHDEPRALHSFGQLKLKCAMVIQATLPGMRFWQHGQFEGYKFHYPVQLGRAPDEPEDKLLRAFYLDLLREVDNKVFHEGSWEICSTHGWPDNNSHENLLAWCWTLNKEKRLIIINFSPEPVEGYVEFPKSLFAESEEFICRDPLKKDQFKRSSNTIKHEGLCVFLDKFDFHFFTIEKE